MEKSSVKHTMNNEYCYALDKDTIMIRISLKANDVKELNTILGAELSERSYMSMEPGCVYWIMEHRIVCYDSAIEMKNNTGLENMWR